MAGCCTANKKGVWPAFDALASVWHPEQIRALSDAAVLLADQATDVAQRVVDAALAGEGSGNLPGLEITNVRRDAGRALAKCHAPSFALEVGRLLALHEPHLTRVVTDALWVAGDSAAENALLKKLTHVVDDSDQDWLQRRLIVRALGSCSTERGPATVLHYLRTEPNISIGLPEDSICPLLQREVLAPAQLADLVPDEQASTQGRTVSVIALGLHDATGHARLFRTIIEKTDEDETLRGYAVRMLGFSGDVASAGLLRRLLRANTPDFATAQAAEALAMLGAPNAALRIHASFEARADSRHAPGFTWALGRLKDEASLPFLAQVLKSGRHFRVRDEVVEAVGAFLPDENARRLLLEERESGSGSKVDSATQCAPIRAPIDNDP